MWGLCLLLNSFVWSEFVSMKEGECRVNYNSMFYKLVFNFSIVTSWISSIIKIKPFTAHCHQCYCIKINHFSLFLVHSWQGMTVFLKLLRSNFKIPLWKRRFSQQKHKTIEFQTGQIKINYIISFTRKILMINQFIF